jgi:hypothetical protein
MTKAERDAKVIQCFLSQQPMLPQLPCIYPFTSNIITDHMLKYDPQTLRSLYKSYSADSTRQLQTLLVTLNISMKNGRTMESHYSIFTS